LIAHTSAFVLDDDPLADTTPDEATHFLQTCRFLQTSQGSFTTSVQLPTQLTIRPQTLLNDAIVSLAVSERLTNILSFIALDVLARPPVLFTESNLLRHLDVVNLKVFEDVKELFAEAGEASLDFSFVSIDNTRDISPGKMTLAKTELLSDYLAFVRQWISGEIEISVQGKIVELRSRNPQGNRNYVVVQAEYERRSTFVAVVLSNELYSSAVQAHRANKFVRVDGRARRMKTQMKISELKSFVVT